MENPSKLSFDLEVSAKLESKIRHLCNTFQKKEWSGILFYRKNGEVGNKGFSVEALDVCLMDIGTGGFTEFDDSQDIIMYRVEHEELLQNDVYEGLIHSHNQMPAFFSGTDTKTLDKEGRDTNHFLSLVVNNEGKYVARITRRVRSEVETNTVTDSKIVSEFNTFGNKCVKMRPFNRKTKNKEKSICDTVEWFNADIKVPNVVIPEEVSNELDERIEVLKERVVEVPITGLRKDTPTQLSFDFWNNDDYYYLTHDSEKEIKEAAETLCYKIATSELLAVGTSGKAYLRMVLRNMPSKYKLIFGENGNSDFVDFVFNLIATITDYPESLLGINDFDASKMYAVIEEAITVIDEYVEEGYVKRVVIDSLTDFLNY